MHLAKQEKNHSPTTFAVLGQSLASFCIVQSRHCHTAVTSRVEKMGVPCGGELFPAFFTRFDALALCFSAPFREQAQDRISRFAQGPRSRVH